MGKVNSIQQHAPLVIPENWNGQEKRLVIQLEEILDDIYRRFGRLRLSDFSGETRGKLTAIFTDGPDKLHNTVVDIDSNGIHMLTGLFRVDAEDEQSYIRFGGTSDEPKFLLGIDGNVLANNGSFKTLYVNGEEVAVSRGTKLVVSDTQPDGNDILWVKPIPPSAPGGEPITFTMQANVTDRNAPNRAVKITNPKAGKIVGACDYNLNFLLTNAGDTSITLLGCTVILAEADADNPATVTFGPEFPSPGVTLTPGGICRFQVSLSGAQNILGGDLTATARMNTNSGAIRYASAIKLTCSGSTASGEPSTDIPQDVQIKYIT